MYYQSYLPLFPHRFFRLVKELQFSVVVFDTAPTGHTLRFLSMPSLFQKGLGKATQLKSQFGSLFDQLLPMLSGGDDSGLRSKMQESMPAIGQINEEFKNPVSTACKTVYKHSFSNNFTWKLKGT